MKFWNNGIICKRSDSCPGDEWIPGRLKFKRVKATEETRRKISEALRNRENGNCWLGKKHSEETKLRMSKSAKLRAERGIIPDNTGREPWNKGLTKETDDRIIKYSSTQTGQLREGNYPKKDFHWNWKDDTNYSKPFYHYRKLVSKLTKATYKKYKHIINPDNKMIGRCGVEGAHQIDHIISVHYGFLNNISAEEISAIDNLKLLTWEENLLKSNN